MTGTQQNLSEVVKKETAAAHAAAEKILVKSLHGMKSREQYAAMLLAFCGFYQPVQQLIQQYITVEDLPDKEQRRTASLLLQDLASLGMKTPEHKCNNLPVITNKVQAFGALYVLEGSTLGGQHITKMLLKNEALQLGESDLTFFNGYKDETGAKWKSFIAALNRQSGEEEIINAAKETFLAFKNWLLECKI